MSLYEAASKRAAIFVLGLSGAGKSTCAMALERYFGFHLISGGRMIRQLAVKSDNPMGRVARAAISHGAGIPDDLVIELYSYELRLAQGKGIVFDGNPRDRTQFVKIVDLIESHGYSAKRTCCIHLKLSPEAALERLYNRRICPVCGFQGASDTCPACGSSTVQRSDDSQLQLLYNKFNWYRTGVLPAIEWFASKSEVFCVDASQDFGTVIEDTVLHTTGFLSALNYA